MHPEASRLIKEQLSEFERYFGREPGDTDPVFTEIYYMINDDRASDLVVRAMRAAGIDEAKIFAYQRTGLIVTAENQDLISGKDLDDWHAAFEEFEELDDHADAGLSTLDRTMLDALRDFRRCTTVMGVVIGHVGERTDVRESYLRSFCFFCFVKSLKTLRALELLVKDDFGEDAMALARSVYESYLHIRYLLECPEKIDDIVVARIGLKTGTHEYPKTKKGRPDYRTIVEVETGRTFTGQISTRTMATASRFEEDLLIHEQLYDLLSRYTHPDFLAVEHYLDEGRFDHRLSTLHYEPMTLGLLFGGLLLDAVAGPPLLTGQIVEDVRFYLGQLKITATELLDELARLNPENGLFTAMRRRVDWIAVRRSEGTDTRS